MSARSSAMVSLALLLLACGNIVREKPSGNTGSSSGGSDACERDCQGQPCTNGFCEPEVLATELYFPSRLALDEARVYWTSAGGTIDALPIAGGERMTLASGQDDPFDIVVDEDGIFFTDSGKNTVVAMPIEGGLTTLLAETGNPLGMTKRGGAVYFTNTYDPLSNDEQVMRAPLPAGPASVIATSKGAWMVATDEAHVYWTDRANQAVWSAPVEGGDAAMIAEGIIEPTDIEVDEEAIYVTALEATYRISIGGGALEPLVWGAGRGLAIDAAYVYVGTADGRVLKVEKAGGAAITLAKGELYPSDIAVDGESVYWVTRQETGVLARTAK